MGMQATAGLFVGTACAAKHQAPSRRVVIAVVSPLTGPLAASGLGIAHSVHLAVVQANWSEAVPGIEFEVKAYDDQGSAGRGRDIAEKLIGRPEVIGVVGPLNSHVAFLMQPLLKDAQLALVSPANTHPALTQGENWLSGKAVRRSESYFRTVATDAAHGPFAARHVHRDPRKKRVLVLDDRGPYGATLATTFADEFRRLGGTVAGRWNFRLGDRSFPGLVDQLAEVEADLVYLGAEHPECAALIKALKEYDSHLALMGGDAVYDPAYIETAGDAAEGDYVTSVGVPLDRLPSADVFKAEYHVVGYDEPPGPYGAYAYDGAMAIVEAVKVVTAQNAEKLPKAPRAAISRALNEVAFTGATGPVSFNSFGDSANQQLTIYQVQKGRWSPLESGTYQE
ncbi:branched-chain amino acid ABC transporter substrate-binding protein [Streptomyces sp. NPDC020681]|uniref:branched-chain amino acid ABC transporter substrate-binding protein n=1 Tax=Streptomyces sp. NPDC020681 TaxID=3365083 RepID=UPI0037A40A34